jgi:hypothetical protein
MKIYLLLEKNKFTLITLIMLKLTCLDDGNVTWYYYNSIVSFKISIKIVNGGASSNYGVKISFLC